MQISPGTTRFFSSIYLPHLLHLSPCSYGLQLVTQSYPQMQPYMRFLYVRPEVCPRVSRFPESGFLQIPSHDEHPCLRLCPSHYRADSGLAPARNVRRRAHVTTTSSTGGLHWALIRADYCFRQKADVASVLLVHYKVVLFSSFLDSSLCSSMYFFIADSVTLTMVST